MIKPLPVCLCAKAGNGYASYSGVSPGRFADRAQERRKRITFSSSVSLSLSCLASPGCSRASTRSIVRLQAASPIPAKVRGKARAACHSFFIAPKSSEHDDRRAQRLCRDAAVLHQAEVGHTSREYLCQSHGAICVIELLAIIFKRIMPLRAAIEKLRADNEALKEEMQLENKFSVRPTSSSAAATIDALRHQSDACTQQVLVPL